MSIFALPAREAAGLAGSAAGVEAAGTSNGFAGDAFGMGTLLHIFPRNRRRRASMGSLEKRRAFSEELFLRCRSVARFIMHSGLEWKNNHIRFCCFQMMEKQSSGERGYIVFVQPLTRQAEGTGNCSAIGCSMPIFDSRIPTQTFHAAPNLWFYEGLATYYENASMSALPEKQREQLGIRPEWQFQSLFNRYLTIRIKDPALFSFAPMDEALISESEGRKEFLHYIQAPLVVKLVEDRASELSGQQDAVLHAILADPVCGLFLRGPLIGPLRSRGWRSIQPLVPVGRTIAPVGRRPILPIRSNVRWTMWRM